MLLQLYQDPHLETQPQDAVLNFLRFCHKELDGVQTEEGHREGGREFAISTFWYLLRWDHRRGQTLAVHSVLYKKLLDKLLDLTTMHARDMQLVTRVNIGHSIAALTGDTIPEDVALSLWDALVPHRPQEGRTCALVHWSDLAEIWTSSEARSSLSGEDEVGDSDHISHRLTKWTMTSHDRLSKVAPVVVTSLLRSLSVLLPRQENELQKGIQQIFSQYMWLEQEALQDFSLSQLLTMVRSVREARMAPGELFANNVAGAVLEICRSELRRHAALPQRLRAKELRLDRQHWNQELLFAEGLCVGVLSILECLPPVRDEIAVSIFLDILVPLSPIVRAVLHDSGRLESGLGPSFDRLLLSLSRVLAAQSYPRLSEIPINVFRPLISEGRFSAPPAMLAMEGRQQRMDRSRGRSSPEEAAAADPPREQGSSQPVDLGVDVEEIPEELFLTEGEIASFRSLLLTALWQYPDFGHLLEVHAQRQLALLENRLREETSSPPPPLQESSLDEVIPDPLETLRACVTSLNSLGVSCSSLTRLLLKAPALQESLRRSIVLELEPMTVLRGRGRVPQEIILAALDSWASGWSWLFDTLRLNRRSVSTTQVAQHLFRVFCEDPTLIELSCSLAEAPARFLYDWLYTAAILELDLHDFPVLTSFWIPRLIFLPDCLTLGRKLSQISIVEAERRFVVWRWLQSRHPILCKSLAASQSLSPFHPHHHRHHPSLLPNIELKLLDLRDRILGDNRPAPDATLSPGSFEGLLTSEFYLNTPFPPHADQSDGSRGTLVASVAWPESNAGIQILDIDPGSLRTPTSDPLISYELGDIRPSQRIRPSLSPSATLDLKLSQEESGWLILRAIGNPSTEELAVVLQLLSSEIRAGLVS